MKISNIKYILFITCLLAFISGCTQKHNEVQGYIEGDYTYVAPALSGKLEQLAVTRGDTVKAGQLLFVLDQQPEADQLKQAQKQLQQEQQTLIDIEKGQRPTILAGIVAQRGQAMAQLKLDRKTLNRYRKLFTKGFITKEELDTAQAAYDSDVKQIKEIDANLAEAKLGARENQIKAQAQVVKAAQDQVKQAEWSLQQKTKYAPVSGFVFDTYYRQGEFIPAGQPVLALLAPQNIRLIFYVPETILSQIKLGQKVQIGCDGCKTKTPATIYYISSNAEYTPPVIYSKDTRANLMYRIEAKIAPDVALTFHTGQPVDVYLTQQ